MLSRIYSDALHEITDSGLRHPRGPADTDGFKQPCLHCGDIFAEDTGRAVLMVISPECGLCLKKTHGKEAA